MRNHPPARVAWLLIYMYVPAAASGQSLSESCRSIRLSGSLTSGERFQKAITPDLVLRLDPEHLGAHGAIEGWHISLAPAQAPSRDYIYPVNPPLRFNGLQVLGPSDGEDTRASLGHSHYARFILFPRDYERMWPLVTNALWPYSAPRPDKAIDEYLRALGRLPTGEMKLQPESYEADSATGSIRHLGFQVELTAPSVFPFDSALDPKPAVCR